MQTGRVNGPAEPPSGSRIARLFVRQAFIGVDAIRHAAHPPKIAFVPTEPPRPPRVHQQHHNHQACAGKNHESPFYLLHKAAQSSSAARLSPPEALSGGTSNVAAVTMR